VLGRVTGNTDTLDSSQPGFGEATTFPLIVYFVAGHGAYIQMAFLSLDSRGRVLKSRQMEFPQLWSPITLRADLDRNAVYSKVVVLVESFPTVCGTLPAAK